MNNLKSYVEAHLLDQKINKFNPKIMNELFRDAYSPRIPFQHFSSVLISDKLGIIKKIGVSKPNNLILDNFGTWFAGLFHQSTSTWFSVNLKENITGSTDAVGMIDGGSVGTYSFCHAVGAHLNGTRIQVGSGTTAPARADYKIETAFGTAPESAVFETGAGSYAAGSMSVAGSITAGGAGTVNETVLFGHWFNEEHNNALDYALFHDAISPGVPFIAAQDITDTYTITL